MSEKVNNQRDVHRNQGRIVINVGIDKRGLSGVYFSYFSTKTCCGYSLETPH